MKVDGTILCALVCLATASAQTSVRVTTWNLEWFPNGSPKEVDSEKQAARILAAAEVLRPLNSDILLLQEVADYDVCAKLADAIKPAAYQVAICSAFKEANGLGKQQIAILAKDFAMPNQKLSTEAVIPYNLACYEAQLVNLKSAKDYLKRAFDIDEKWRLVTLDDQDLEPLWTLM